MRLNLQHYMDVIIDYSLFNTFLGGVFTMITVAFGMLVIFLIIAVFYSIGDNLLKKSGESDVEKSITLTSFLILMVVVVSGFWVAQLVYFFSR